LKKLPELTRIDIRRGQDGFRKVRPGPLVVVISGGDVDGLRLGHGESYEHNRRKKSYSPKTPIMGT